ncbi:MAG: pitrilysin family protein [Tidjanibacter sp.]|nr:pitrilysin family protein [Tidjanibacter sp.]
MIEYKECRLDNGLTVLASRDEWSRMAAVNLLYRAGSVDEQPDCTGIAHLFEHLMFRGTRRVPSYDNSVQRACGESNAFTTNDYTDYYLTLPKESLETALWLESDRMNGLLFDNRTIEVEKSVVIEEFNQRYLNQPYGDEWHTLRRMVYTVHPYRWPTIGLSTDQIRNASTERIRSFYKEFYTPSNAILSVVADCDPQEIFRLTERWFGGIGSHCLAPRIYPAEPPQRAPRRTELTRERIASDKITIAFPMEGRASAQSDEGYNRGFYLCDFLTDILAGGESSRLYRSMVKEQHLFSSVNAFITGEVQSGMLVLTGEVGDGVEVRRAEKALWEQLQQLVTSPPDNYECEKVRNKFEANTLFGELNVMNKAMNLGYYRFVGNMTLLNGETAIYRTITPEELSDYIERNLTVERSSTLIYHRER